MIVTISDIKPNDEILLNGQGIWQMHKEKKWAQINCGKAFDVLYPARKTFTSVEGGLNSRGKVLSVQNQVQVK